MSVTVTPRATYRVQLHAGFGFAAAADLVEYLDELGVSHLYTSPSLQATAGSTHGYDVVDPTRLSDELGGADAHTRLCAALRRRQMGLVLDIVPNHMAIGSRSSAWWWDVLENGPSSVYADAFDVDWDTPGTRLQHRVLLPVLDDHLGRVVERGDIRLVREGGRLLVEYPGGQAPVSPRTLAPLLRSAAEDVIPVPDLVPGPVAELASIAAAFGRLPHAARTDRTAVVERHRDKEVLARSLKRLLDAHPELAEAVDRVVDTCNASAEELVALLDRQNYRLAFWRTAGHDLDYRRFFDISSLVGLRVERPHVFDDTHGLVLQLVAEQKVDGLRADHVDGLCDPAGYLRRLATAAPGAYVVVEKILGPDEQLPPSWPVAGTTGYDFLNDVLGLFVDPAGEPAMTEAYASFTGVDQPFDEVAAHAKREVLDGLLRSELERLTSLFADVCDRHVRFRDYVRPELRDALAEVVAALPVYRTYVDPFTRAVTADDEASVEAAVAAARGRRPDLDGDLLTFLGAVLLLRHDGEAEGELVSRVQQVTPPVTAKGVEDTALYRYNRLLARNDVGGDPGRFAVAVDEFHHRNRRMAVAWPATMLATSTHDTKRSEDVRARLAVLSEVADEWTEAVDRWAKLADVHRRGPDLPDRNTEWLLYQTLVGAWPIEAERVTAYLEKAVREAKVHTSWTDAVPEYEDAVRRFAEGVLADPALVDDVAAFAASLTWPGRVNSLAQTLCKLTAPGVPDLYQGTELWDLSLVDPDNRRPVDYETRRRLLGDVADATPEEVVARADEGAPKLWLVRRALGVRRRLPEAFAPGAGYEALAADGDRRDHVVAFARRAGGSAGVGVVTLVPRLVIGLERAGGWGDTVVELPEGPWDDVLGGGRFDGGPTPVAALTARFPVALLARRAP